MVVLTLLKTFLATYYSNCFQKLSVSKNVNKKIHIKTCGHHRKMLFLQKLIKPKERRYNSMARKRTSKRMASKASRALKNSRSSKLVKSLAGCVLSQCEK